MNALKSKDTRDYLLEVREHISPDMTRRERRRQMNRIKQALSECASDCELTTDLLHRQIGTPAETAERINDIAPVRKRKKMTMGRLIWMWIVGVIVLIITALCVLKWIYPIFDNTLGHTEESPVILTSITEELK